MIWFFYFGSFSVPPASRLHPFGLGIRPIRPVMISGFLSADGFRFLRHPLPTGGLGFPYGSLTGWLFTNQTPLGLPRSTQSSCNPDACLLILRGMGGVFLALSARKSCSLYPQHRRINPFHRPSAYRSLPQIHLSSSAGSSPSPLLPLGLEASLDITDRFTPHCYR